MKHSMIRATLAGACALVALAAMPAFAQNIAVVNGKPIPKAKADEMIAQITKGGQQKETPEMDAFVKDRLVARELLIQEADRRKLSQDPQIQEQMDAERQNVLVNAVIVDYIKANPPTEAEMHTKYDEIVSHMSSKEYHVHHILVEKEADAKSIIAKLKAGASFDDLAVKMSKDTGSAPKGGDLGWVSQSDGLVPEFVDAVTKLQKGTYTQAPVKTQYGFHVIRLDDVRDHKIETYDEVKDRLVAIVSQDRKWQEGRVAAMVSDLKTKAKIE